MTQVLNAKAIAQAAKLDDAAKALKRANYATREALHAVRQVQAELNGIEVETIKPTALGAKDDTTQSEAQAA